MKNDKTIISKSDYEKSLKELNDRVGNKLNAHGSTALLILMAFGLTACGGSSDVQQNYSSGGTAVKGPLSKATVFIDLDNDGVLDSNELSTTTSSTGTYSFSTTNQSLLQGDIVVQTNENTTDASSGEILSGLTLTASEGSTVVSPATTLIKSIVDGGATVAAAEAKVQAALGITEDVDLSTFNPFATDNISAAKEVEAAAQKIVAIANTVAAAAEAAGADKDVALASALDTIATEANSATTPLDLSDTTGTGVISKVVTAVNTATSTVADASITNAIANINTAIDTTVASATTLDDARETFAIAQSTLTEAAIATVTGDTYIATQLGTTSDPTALKTISSTSISIKGNKGSVSESDEAITATGSLTLSDPDTSDAVTYRVKEGSATLLGTNNLLGGSLNVDATGNWTYSLDVTGDATKLALLQELQSKTYQGDLATNSGKPAISNFQIIEKFEVQIEKVDSTTDAENPTITDATYADASLIKKVITIVINGTNDTVIATANGAAIANVSDAVQGTAITNIDASQYFTDKELDAGDTTGGASGAGDKLTYTVAGLPEGLSINATTGVISGTPSSNTLGNYNVVVTATDIAGSSATQSFIISVDNVNDAPTVSAAITDKTTNEDAVFSLDTSSAFSDADIQFVGNADNSLNNEVLTYSAALANGSPLPSWLSINSTTGVLSGTPKNADVGTISVTVTATDVYNAAVSDTFDITVSNTNDEPTASNKTSVTLGDLNTLSIDASYLSANIADVDVDDTLKVTSVSITTGGGSVTETSTGSGVWVYTPPDVDVDTAAVLRYTIADVAGSTATANVEVNIVDAIPLADAVDEESSAVQLAVPSSSDFNSATITFDSGQTAKGTFNSSNLTFTPAADFNGTVNFTITLADGTTTLPGVLVVQPVNDAPVYSAASTNASFVENAAVTNVVHDASTGASDVDGDTLTYSISGTDAGSFDVDSASGDVTFKTSPNYETKNSYSLTLTSTDGSGATATQALTVTVTDANDSPVFSAATATGSVAENAATSTQIFDANSTDEDTGDTLTYSLTGTDANLVDIDASTGVVTLKGSADFEAKTSYSFNVVASDGTSTATQAVTVSVTNVNEAPTVTSSTAGSVAENAATSSVIYTAAASDVDVSDTISYSVSGTDSSLLNIDTSTGEVTLKTSADYETKSTYSFDVVATDAAGLTDAETVTVSVSDINDAPTASALTSVFLSDANTLTINSTYLSSVINDVDAGDTLKITNVSIANNGIGSVAETSSGSGSWVYTPSSVSSNTDVVLNYTVSDAAGATDNSTLTITVVDAIPLADAVDEESSAVQLAVPSSSDFNSATITFDSGQTAKGTFNSSNLTFTPAADFNGTVNFTITLADGTTTLPGVLVVQPVNDAPVYSAASTNASFVENAAVTNVVHDASTGASDVDGDTLTYSISGTDAGSFDVDSASGDVTFKTSPNYETKNSYSLTLTSTDGSGATATQALTVTVTDANDSPVFSAATATGSVAENAATSTQIFDANSTDEDTGDTLTYSLTGTDANLVDIDASTGVVTLKGSADFEAKTSYSFNVVASDGTSTATQAVTVSVTNVNEAPTVTSSTAGSVKTYAVTVGAATSGSGNRYFIDGIEAPELFLEPGRIYKFDLSDSTTANHPLDFNVSGLGVNLDISTTGTRGSDQIITVTVPDDASGAISYYCTLHSGMGNTANLKFTVAENAAASTVIYTALASDVDAGDSATYSLSGTDSAQLNIDTSTGEVTLKTSADYETKSSYSFDVVATDTAGLTGSKSVSVSVLDVNDAPTGSVTISGSAKAYETLTATNDIADEDGMGTVSYQWFANGAAISGATSNTYSVKYADIGSVITAKATFTDLGDTSETVESSATSTVVDADYLVTASNVRAIETAGATDQTIAQYVQGITDFTNVWAFDLNLDASSLSGGSLQTFSGVVADINIANTSSLSAVTTGSHLSVGWINGVTGEQNNLISSADFGKIAGSASTALVDNDASTATPETAKIATVYLRTADATSSVDLDIVDITFAGVGGTSSLDASPLIVEII